MSRSRDSSPSATALFVTITAVLLVFGGLSLLFAPELTADEQQPSEGGPNGTPETATAATDSDRGDEPESATPPSDPTADADGDSDDEPGPVERPAVDSERDADADADTDADADADTADDSDDSGPSLFERILEGTDTTDEPDDADESDDRERGPPDEGASPDDSEPVDS